MGVTGRSYCDFFVYTKVGYHLERIQFNEKLWEEMKEKFYWFWLNILCHELLCHTIKDSAVKDNDSLSAKEVHVHETIKKSMNVTKKRKAQELSTVSQANLKEVKVHETITNSNVTKKRKAQESSTISQANSKKIQIDETTVKRLTNATKKKKQTTKRKAKAQSVYLCGLCKGQLVTDPTTYDDFSIGCDSCPLWFHFKCAGISKSFDANKQKKWHCKDCTK